MQLMAGIHTVSEQVAFQQVDSKQQSNDWIKYEGLFINSTKYKDTML